MRAVFLIICLGAFLGCAVAPMKTYNFNPVARVDADFESVWAAATEYFVVAGLPIGMLQKESGLIASGWINAADEAGRGEDKTVCDCGPLYTHTVSRWVRGKVTVLVQTLGDRSCDLRVTCAYEQYRAPDQGGRGEVVGCNSTGGLEKSVQDYVLAKVQGAALPPVRAFKASEPH